MRKKLDNRASALSALMWLLLLALIPAQLSARDFKYTYNGQTLIYTVVDESAKTVMTKPGTDEDPGNLVTGDLEIPSEVSDGTNTYKVTAIGNTGFYMCKELTSVVIPTSVTSINEWAFANCKKLERIDIPSSVTSIAEAVFVSSGLTSVNIPSSVTSIGEIAFKKCRKLERIDIPSSVTSIDREAFSGSGLISVTIPSSVTSIGKFAFSDCDKLESVEIPNSVTTIEDGTFRECNSLSSIVIPNSVTTIGSEAFKWCHNLKSITLPASLTKLGDGTFVWADKLRSITIPASVKELGSNVFSMCLSLREIKFEGNEIPKTDLGTFWESPEFTQIVVPADKVDAWKALFAEHHSWPKCTITDKYTPVKKTITGVKPTPVDMGLSVKWADVDLGSATKTTSGKLLKLSDQDMEAYLGEGWRVPTEGEFKELFKNCVAQLYLNQAGVPSKVVYTSKKNGAKITFYFPKTAFIKNGEKLVNPLKGTYQTMYACYGSDVMLSVAAKLPEHIRKPIQDYVAAAKVKSMNIADWPDEMLKWLKSNAEGVNLDSKFLYGSKDDFVEDVNVDIFECFFRPVYVVDESSDED